MLQSKLDTVVVSHEGSNSAMKEREETIKSKEKHIAALESTLEDSKKQLEERANAFDLLTKQSTEERSTLQEQNRQLSQQVDALTKDIAEFKHKEQELHHVASTKDIEIKSLQSRLETLELSNNSTEGNASALKEKLIAQDEALRSKESLMEALNMNLQDVRQQLDEKTKLIDTLNMKNDSIEKQLQQMTTKAQESQAQLSQQLEKVDLLMKDVQSTINNQAELTATIQKRESEIKDLQSSIDAVTNAKTAVERDLENAKANIVDLNAQLATKTQQIESAQRSLDEATGVLTQKDAEIRSLASKVSSLETHSLTSEGNTSVLNEKIASHEESIKAKEKLIAALEGNVTDLRTQYEAQSKTLASAEETSQQREKTIKEWEEKYKVISEHQDHLKKQNEELQTQVEDINSRLAAKEDELLHSQHKLKESEEQSRHHVQQIENLTKDLELAHQSSNMKDDELKILQKRLDAIAQEKDSVASSSEMMLGSMKGEWESIFSNKFIAYETDMLSAKEKMIGSLEEALQNHRSQLSEKEASLELLTSKHFALEEQLQRISNQLAAALEQAKHAQNNMEELKARLETKDLEADQSTKSWTQQTDKLTQELAEKRQENDRVNANILTQDQEIKRLQDALAQKEGQVATLQATIDSLELEKSNDETNLELVRLEKDQLEQQIAQLKEESQVHLTSNKDSSDEILKMKGENDKLHQEIDTMNAALRSIQHQLEMAEEKLKEAEEANEGKTEIDRSALAEIYVEKELLQKEISRLKDELDKTKTFEVLLKTKDQRIESLEQEHAILLERAKQAETTLQDEQQNFQDELNIMKKQVTMFKERLDITQDEMIKRDRVMSDKLAAMMGIKKREQQGAALLEEYEKARAKAIALQNHNSFLFAEIERLEGEKGIRNKAIDRIKRQLKEHLNLNKTIPEAHKQTHEQYESLKEQYFRSLAVGVKLQGSMIGWYCNADMNLLYEEVLNEKVELNDWPQWVTEQIKKRSEKA